MFSGFVFVLAVFGRLFHRFFEVFATLLEFDSAAVLLWLSLVFVKPLRFFVALRVEMELEGLGEFLFRVSGRGVFFTEADEVLSYVAAFDSARDALREKLESEGDEGCVLAAEDGWMMKILKPILN